MLSGNDLNLYKILHVSRLITARSIESIMRKIYKSILVKSSQYDSDTVEANNNQIRININP